MINKMKNFTRGIFLLVFVTYLAFAQGQFINNSANISKQAVIELLNKLLESQRQSLVNQSGGSVSAEPTPAPTIFPTSPTFDEDREDDVLIQLNNLRITKIVPSQTGDVKAYLYAVKDVGWICNFYGSGSTSSNITSACPFNVRRSIVQKEIIIRVNSDTILLLRNRVKTDISQFNVGDKINVYGFFDQDNLTFDSLVIRQVVGTKNTPLLRPISPPVLLPGPLPVVPTSSPTTSLSRQKLFVGYLEKIKESSIAVEGNIATSSERESLYLLTLDNNLVYVVKPAAIEVKNLLDKYSNNRVRLAVFVEKEASSHNTGSLVAINVSLLPSLSPVKPTSTLEKATNSVSGFLTETGMSIYMWGSHTLKGDDGKIYLVKALNNNVLDSLKKYTGKRVIIYAEKIYYNDLEGGFWAIEAKQVLPLNN
ncbi:MAG: hypothetical protein KatS3mg095_0419 [Candidatus Parcubacteria bacterium]|nr:MAG: hypothetical protein KatS3mg095_0419 [Candidatus Parcubacteria bacterium]